MTTFRRPALLLLMALTLSCGGRPVSSSSAPPHRYEAPLRAMVDRGALDRAMRAVAPRLPRPMRGARAVIVPHHWLAGELILSTLQDAAAAGPWDRIVLIGPNHPDAGSASAITADAPWSTALGPVSATGEIARRLVSSGLARIEPAVLEREHSVAGLMVAVRVALPDVSVVPLILRSHQRLGDLRRLARELVSVTDERTLIVASVDFSHGLSAAEARARGRETGSALGEMDIARIFAMGNDHLDSPSTMVVVMEMMRLLGSTRFIPRANTDSSSFGASSRPPATGYITGYFS